MLDRLAEMKMKWLEEIDNEAGGAMCRETSDPKQACEEWRNSVMLLGCCHKVEAYVGYNSP